MHYLYLHGFASGPTSTKARFFHDRFRDAGLDLLILDLAEGDFEHLTISRQLAVIEQAAGGGPCVLIGSSLGGYLSALYAARHPEVHRLVLLAPAFRFPTHYPESLGPEKLAGWRDTGHLAVFHYGEKQDRNLSYAFYTDGIRYEAEPDFAQPALILHGLHDTVVPSGFSAEFARSRPHVQLVTVNSGHELNDVLDTLWEHTRRFLSF